MKYTLDKNIARVELISLLFKIFFKRLVIKCDAAWWSGKGIRGMIYQWQSGQEAESEVASWDSIRGRVVLTSS